ncbi:MAG TPA: hypothetical protein VMW58_10370 [Anaerolineae bacterium]|nr:hypothetical protein [Anaerolineae bacterium]
MERRQSPPRAAHLLSVTILMACLAACRAGEATAIDKSLLTGQPCGPPCWQGLVPGVSTEGQIEDFVSESDYVDDHYRDMHGGETIIWWQAAPGGRDQGTTNAFGIREGVLSSMVVSLDYELTLDQLLARYGPPEKLWVQWSAGGSAVALVNLYYPSQGFIPQVELEPSNGYHELTAQDTVRRVWYFPPTTLEELANLGPSIPFPPREYVDTDVRDWAGFGRIRVR